jgi:hypothetical protein
LNNLDEFSLMNRILYITIAGSLISIVKRTEQLNKNYVKRVDKNSWQSMRFSLMKFFAQIIGKEGIFLNENIFPVYRLDNRYR